MSYVPCDLSQMTTFPGYIVYFLSKQFKDMSLYKKGKGLPIDVDKLLPVDCEKPRVIIRKSWSGIHMQE